MVMDNLCVHKGERVRKLVENAGATSCSTCRHTRRTSNPTEEAYSKVKSLLRQVEKPETGKRW
jgi:hypothetical protein